MAKKTATKTPNVFTRDENGLVEGFTYSYKPSGLIDWQQVLKDNLSQHIVLFKEKKEQIEKKYGVPLYSIQKKLQSGEMAQDEVDDKFKLVLLAGWRELAKIRGYVGWEFPTMVTTDNFCAATCKITWIGIQETGGQTEFSSDGADSHFYNTYDFTRNYLTAMTMNRAFGRAVRSYLNINILSADEISDKEPRKQEEKQEVSSTQNFGVGPIATLQKIVTNDLGYPNFEAFKDFLRENYKEKGEKSILGKDAPSWKDYQEYSDIKPAREAGRVAGRIKLYLKDEL